MTDTSEQDQEQRVSPDQLRFRTRRSRQRMLASLESRLTWIVGSPRAGTTWLARMLDDHATVRVLDEPLIGMHIGVLADQVIAAPGSAGESVGRRVVDVSAACDDYFFAERFRHAWAPALRGLVLERIAAQVTSAGA